MKIQRLISSFLASLFPLFITNITSAETFNCKSSETATVIKLITNSATCPECPVCTPITSCPAGYSCQPDAPSPSTEGDSDTFLSNYTNMEQQKLPADGIYPLGQIMPISGYSSNGKQLIRMKNAGFSMDGPHYHSTGKYMMKNWESAEATGMKNYYRLRDVGGKHWPDLFQLMKTPEKRALLEKRIVAMINSVLSNAKLNSNVSAWYGFQEEPIYRSQTPVDKQREYMEFVHDIIKKTDTKKRPLYISERTDSSLENMMGNSCFQDGSMKQNYLIKRNGYGDDSEMRYIIHQWALDQVKTASEADKRCPSYTGKPRAAISTLPMFRDPDNTEKRNEKSLRRWITHDIYTQLAAGIDGFALYTWSKNPKWSQKTKALQESIYMDVFGQFTKSGLGEVFLWGDDRDDIQIEITEGPATIRWRKGINWFTSPSIQMRNIQHGKKRYILLVNSSKEVVRPRLSGFPSGLKIIDILSQKTDRLKSSITPTIQPLGIQMYKITL